MASLNISHNATKVVKQTKKAPPTPDNHSSPTLPVYSISRAPTVTFVTPPGHIRPEPVVLTFDSDDAFNNAIRTPDGKALYLVSTPKRTNATIITGRREGASTSASLNAMDRPIATLVRNRWKSDKIMFGESPPSDVAKLFKTPTTSTMMSEWRYVSLFFFWKASRSHDCHHCIDPAMQPCDV